MLIRLLPDSFQYERPGRVKHQNNCATCYSVSMLPVDGKIVGRRLRAGNGLPERWLIEADVTLKTNGVSISQSL